MTTNVIENLQKAEIPYVRLPHRRTETAHQEARAIGVPDAAIAKTVVLTTPDGFVRAVLPASERLDLAKIHTWLGIHSARLATEAELTGAYPMFELGAVPPFGGPPHDRAVVDTRLAERDDVVLEAGTHEESVRIAARSLLELSGAEVCDICED